jgi:hypothetical protein
MNERKEIKMLSELDDWDWAEVFKYADPERVITAPESLSISRFERDGVKRVIAMESGDNDGPEWVGVFELWDGRFASIRAGCDYTGWG